MRPACSECRFVRLGAVSWSAVSRALYSSAVRIGAAVAAVGVGHAIAGLLDPVTSPILAVGSVLIDAAPTPAKEFAVRTFGNYDKPILIGSVGLALMIFAAGLVSSAVFIHTLGMAGLVLRADVTWAQAWDIDKIFWIGDVLKNVAMALVATAVHRAFPDLLHRRRAA